MKKPRLIIIVLYAVTALLLFIMNNADWIDKNNISLWRESKRITCDKLIDQGYDCVMVPGDDNLYYQTEDHDNFQLGINIGTTDRTERGIDDTSN